MRLSNQSRNFWIMAVTVATTLLFVGGVGSSFAQSSAHCEGYARDYADRNSSYSSGGGAVGGAVRTGVGGAIIGGIAGGSRGARTGAAIGAQIGATATRFFAGPRIRLAFSVLPLIGAIMVVFRLVGGVMGH